MHERLIDQKGLPLTCQTERTTERGLSQEVNHLGIDGHAKKIRAALSP